MSQIKRRTVITALGLGGAAALGIGIVPSLRQSLSIKSLPPAPVTFGEWELVVLDAKNAAILVLDPIDEKLLARFPVGGAPTGILLSGNAKMAVAVDADAQRLTMIRRKRGLEQVALPITLRPSLVTLSPSGALFVVLDQTTGDLAILSSEDGRELFRHHGLGSASNMAFDQFGDRLFITQSNSPEIQRFDLRTLKALSPITVKGAPGFSSLLTMRGEDFALAMPLPGKQDPLYAVDLETGETKLALTLPSPISGAVLDPQGYRLFAASSTKPEIYRRSLFGDYEATIVTDHPAEEIMLGGLGRWLYVVSEQEAAFSLYTTSNNALASRHDLPQRPNAVIYHRWSGKTLVAMEAEASLWLLEDGREPRRLGLNGAAPAQLATADTAICHT